MSSLSLGVNARPNTELAPLDGAWPATAQRDPQRWLARLTRHGADATAFAGVEPFIQHWFCAQGAVAYVEAAGHRVAAGPPVSAPADQAAVAQAFAAAARAVGRRAVFFAVDDDFRAALAAAGSSAPAVPVGLQPEWDLAQWSLDGARRRGVRAQVRRAAAKGVQVQAVPASEFQTAEAPLRVAADALIAQWLTSRAMPPMGFMVDPVPFGPGWAQRRFFVARRGEALVGLLVAVPTWSPTDAEAGSDERPRPADGWFVEDVFRLPTAPNGTAEALVCAAFDSARAEGATAFTLGLAPLAGVEGGPGPGRLLRGVMVRCRRHLGGLYGFEGVARFKAHFRPDRWAPRWLVAVDAPLGPWALWAVLAAFARGRPLRFALRTAWKWAAGGLRGRRPSDSNPTQARP